MINRYKLEGNEHIHTFSIGQLGLISDSRMILFKHPDGLNYHKGPDNINYTIVKYDETLYGHHEIMPI